MEPLSREEAELHSQGQPVQLEKAILGWCRRRTAQLQTFIETFTAVEATSPPRGGARSG